MSSSLLSSTTERVPEDVKGIVEPSAAALLLLQALLAEAVVDLALLGIRQGFVCVSNLEKLALGLLAGILVRVILLGQFLRANG